MVAAFNSSERICIWLQRLIDDRGGKVKVPQELAEFAKLTFRDGRIALYFETLLTELQGTRWITWNKGKEKRCSEGHVLELWGSGSYQQHHLWRCHGNDPECIIAGYGHLGLHLGVSRYHCRICQKDLCKDCAVGERESSMLSTVAVPILGFESLKETVSEVQETVKSARDCLMAALQYIDVLLVPTAKAGAWTMYGSSLLASCMLGIFITFAGARFANLACVSFQALCFIMGAAVLTQQTAWARRLAAVSRANWDFLAARKQRAKGGCASWAFYVALSR